MPTPPIRPEKSALQVFLRVLAVIFLAEGSVMLLLEFVLPKMPDLVEAAFDATLLSLIATPFLWRWLVVSDRERRQAEQELQRTNTSLHAANLELERTMAEAQRLAVEAQAAEKAKSAFLANMSHELNTPLNPVLGLSEILLTTPLSPKQREYCEAIQRGGNALHQVIRDILEFSKLEAGQLSPVLSAVKVRSCMMLALDHARPETLKKPVQLRSSIAPEVPETIMGDAAMLGQVLDILIGNAMKFTIEGEVLVTVSLSATGSAGLRLCFEVRDSGIGIKEEDLAAIFRSFNQADNSDTRNFGGTGLGLSIAQRLVRLLGGEIAVESEMGRGSVFRFDLPCEPAS